MNLERRQAAADRWTKPTDLWGVFAWSLKSAGVIIKRTVAEIGKIALIARSVSKQPKIALRYVFILSSFYVLFYLQKKTVWLLISNVATCWLTTKLLFLKFVNI